MHNATHNSSRPPSRSTKDSEPRSAHRAAIRYTLVVTLLPLIAVPLFIALGRSDFFLSHGASVWVRSNDSVFAMRGRDCDVLVYGDSTAMTGINPDIVERQTGLRTCNISVTNSVLAVTGDLTLRHYLEQNHKPRVLLIQLSPDSFQSNNHAWRNTIYPEGLLELLRHEPSTKARRTLLHHPQESIAFAGYAAGFSVFYDIKDLWFHLTKIRSGEDRITIRNGFLTPPSPPRTSCDPALSVASRISPDYPRSLVDGYRREYGTQADLVLINVAPIPSCDQNLAAYSSQLDGITSNTLVPLPISLFNDGRHYTSVGAGVVSGLVSEELNDVPGLAPHKPSSNTFSAALAGLHRIGVHHR